MSKWFHPAILLLCGSVFGGVVVAVYLTGMFGVRVPESVIPREIDSGWGSLVGGSITGLFAIGLFWGQRYVDRRDRIRAFNARDMLKVSIAQQHLEQVEEFFSKPVVVKSLKPWIDKETGAYQTEVIDEILKATSTIQVYTKSFPAKLLRASEYLYEVSGDGEGLTDLRSVSHHVAISLRDQHDDLVDKVEEIWEQRDELFSNPSKGRLECLCIDIATAISIVRVVTRDADLLRKQVKIVEQESSSKGH